MRHPDKLAAGSKAAVDFVSGALDPGPPPASWSGVGGYAAKTGYDWYKKNMGDSVKVKIWEWIVSILFIFNGSAMILTKYYEIRGHPVFPWVPYLILIAGIAIPILAWFFRSRDQANEK